MADEPARPLGPEALGCSRRSRSAARPPGGSRPSRRGRPPLDRRGDGRPVRGGGRVDRAVRRRRPTGSSSRSRPASRARASSASRSAPTRASPATSTRPARRSPCRTSRAIRGSGGPSPRRRPTCPRSIVAVPLVDDHGTIGVLEVLDKRSQAAFSLRDIELAGVFARQAAVAIRASRVERDLGVAPPGHAPRPGATSAGPTSDAAIDELVRAGDRRARTRRRLAGSGRSSSRSPGSAGSDPDQLELVTDLLAALARQAERDARPGDAAGRARAPAPPTVDRSVPARLERAVRRRAARAGSTGSSRSPAWTGTAPSAAPTGPG